MSSALARNALEETRKGDADRGFITFRVSGEKFGVELLSVREILKINLRSVTPLFRVPEFLVGVVNLRGQIKPVLDLGLFLGIAGADPKRPRLRSGGPAGIEVPAVAVVQDESDLVCLVDRIDRVVWSNDDDLREVDSIIDEGLRRCVRHTLNTGRQPISILNVEAVFGSEVWTAYQ